MLSASNPLTSHSLSACYRRAYPQEASEKRNFVWIDRLEVNIFIKALKQGHIMTYHQMEEKKRRTLKPLAAEVLESEGFEYAIWPPTQPDPDIEAETEFNSAYWYKPYRT